MPTDSPASPTRRLIVGITGATGIVYGIRLLEALRDSDIDTHLVMSRAAARTLAYEAERSVDEVRALADVSHPIGDIGASIASGSYRTMGMIVAPCSIKSMSDIAAGTTDNLLTRAADVTLKERRPLVMLVRETPLHAGHLRTMLRLAEIGAVIMPPVPAFYTRPKTIDDIVDQTVGRALDAFDIDVGLVKRWQGGASQNLGGTMTLRSTTLATGLAIAAATAAMPGAMAQNAASNGTETPAVYEFLKATENRVWRLNKQTGEIAVCTLEVGEALVCSTSAGAAETPATTYEELQQRRAAEAAERQAADAEERARAFEFLDRMMNLFREYAEKSPPAEMPSK